jgi:hypothetical protein
MMTTSKTRKKDIASEEQKHTGGCARKISLWRKLQPENAYQGREENSKVTR